MGELEGRLKNFGGLEAVVSDSSRIVPTLSLEGHIRQVKFRVCMIHYPDREGGLIQGTGFLIGPDLILTNYHVMENAIERNLEGDSIRIRFSYSADYPTILDEQSNCDLKLFSTNWLCTFQRYAESDKTGTPPFAEADQLDYAIIRLQSRAGDDPVKISLPYRSTRGWFRLGSCNTNIPEKAVIAVFQHPRGRPICTSEGTVITPVSHERCSLRLHHNASTDHGSSGSPCFINQYTCLVAVHHAGDPSTVFKPKYNQAIPLKLIVDDLRRLALDSLVDQPHVPASVLYEDDIHFGKNGPTIQASQNSSIDVALRLCRVGPQPFAGRDQLRENLRLLADNRPKGGVSMLISGPTASGKSHSWYLIRHVANICSGVVAQLLDISAMPATQRELSNLCIDLERLVPQAKFSTLHADLAQDACLSKRIIKEICAKSVAQETCLWLVVDGLDEPETPDDTVSFFYDLGIQVSKGCAANTNLIILGQARALPGSIEYELNSVVERLSLLSRGDLLRYLSEETRARKFFLSESQLSQILDVCFEQLPANPSKQDFQRMMLALRNSIDQAASMVAVV